MRTQDRLADIALGVLSVVTIAATAIAIGNSWGGGYWMLGAAIGVITTVVALGRRLNRAWAAVAGLAVALVAIIVAGVGDLPREPAPATILALAVLVAAAIRALPAYWAGGIAAGGLVVVVAGELLAPASSSSVITVLSGLGWVVAVVIGLSLRMAGARNRGGTADVYGHEHHS
ncbi:MAG TPA: hypothetical protein VGP57_11930 [Actinoplanes sp.]|nr:hypothetical protein [Actinoplanes sp.]